MKDATVKSPLNSYLYPLDSWNFCVIIPLVKREVLKHGQVADSIFKSNGLSFSFVFFFFFFLLQWRASALFQWILIEKKWLTTTFKMLGGSWGSRSTFPELRGDSSGRAWMPAVEQDTTAAWQVRVSSPRTPTAGQTNCAPNPADCYRRLAGRHWWDVADVWN